MGAITTAVVAIAAVILGWATIEIACKPCLEQGRDAIDRALDPNYDPDSPVNSENRTAAEPLLRDEPAAPSAPPAAKIA
ncbi:outer envelope membrane protein 7 [Canna indica]|uniref:Outer envelope membrane protein 7 n=1 Tax=Canna indica TaxID=4628 RepID=A0AAQ3KGV6_9LILI|nr:outer envelope membrane protein 7 [Canna indica]